MSPYYMSGRRFLQPPQRWWQRLVAWAKARFRK